MAELEKRSIVLDLNHILWEYAKKNLRDFKMEYLDDIVVDIGQRKVSFHWYVEKEKEK